MIIHNLKEILDHIRSENDELKAISKEYALKTIEQVELIQ